MTQNPTQSAGGSDAIAAFSGLVILLVILSILFFVTSPEPAEVVIAVPTAIPTEIPTAVPTPTEAPTAVPEQASSDAGSAYDPAVVAAGEQLFIGTCSSCHGIDAHGLPGVGKDLVSGEFPNQTGDDDLVAFIITGRPSYDPANTTFIDMPARGGNPMLTDEDIHAIVAYLRTLQAQ